MPRSAWLWWSHGGGEVGVPGRIKPERLLLGVRSLTETAGDEMNERSDDSLAELRACSHPSSVTPSWLISNPETSTESWLLNRSNALGTFCTRKGLSGSNLVISGLPSRDNAARTAPIVKPYRNIRKYKLYSGSSFSGTFVEANSCCGVCIMWFANLCAFLAKRRWSADSVEWSPIDESSSWTTLFSGVLSRAVVMTLCSSRRFSLSLPPWLLPLSFWRWPRSSNFSSTLSKSRFFILITRSRAWAALWWTSSEGDSSAKLNESSTSS